MIKGWDWLTKAHLGIAGGFIIILLSGQTNMFTIPITIAFMITSAYCALQWHAMKLFAKIEKKHPNWK